jgi:hypothetical protein
MDYMERQINKEVMNLTSCKWGEAHTSYARLFCEAKGDGAELLKEWLQLLNTRYRCPYSKQRNLGIWIELTRSCISSDEKVVDVLLMVPHPRHLEEVNLIKEFKALEPPSLPVESAEAISIQNLPAKLYHRKDAKCTLLIKLNKGTVLNFETQCSSTDHMINLANSLSVHLLNNKLGP